MAIRPLYSERAAEAARAGRSDVYKYDDFPPEFRAQVVHIWDRAVGDFPPFDPLGGDHDPSDPPTYWKWIARRVAEAHGLLSLDDPHWPEPPRRQCSKYFLELTEPRRILDVIECAFNVIDEDVRSDEVYRGDVDTPQNSDDAIADLNHRFRQHGIGYQYANGQIIRVDSEYIHAEVVKPALALLQDAAFAGPQDEFLRAHAHYREGECGPAMVEALKSFESTMKSIFDERAWTYDKEKDSAQKLIEVVVKEGLLPTYLESGLGAFRTVLESLVPTLRNRNAGHGQGQKPREIPPHLAAYVLHVTAANIVLLVEAHKAKPK